MIADQGRSHEPSQLLAELENPYIKEGIDMLLEGRNLVLAEAGRLLM